MTALLAAIGVCAAGAAVGQTLAGSPPPAAAGVNTDNGVHAVPSGEVNSASLAEVGALTPVQFAAPAPLAVPAAFTAPAPLAVPAPPAPEPELEQAAESKTTVHSSTLDMNVSPVRLARAVPYCTRGSELYSACGSGGRRYISTP